MLLISEHVAYTRDIRNYWLQQVYSLSMKFRTAYELFMGYDNNTNVSISRRGIIFQYNRRTGKTTFDKFLSLLVFPPEAAISSPFICSSFATSGNDGEIFLDTLVIDGTPVGLLGTLSVSVQLVTKCVPHLHLFRTIATRKFIDYLLGIARLNSQGTAFKISASDRVGRLDILQFFW